jgi:hypothetical protein
MFTCDIDFYCKAGCNGGGPGVCSNANCTNGEVCDNQAGVCRRPCGGGGGGCSTSEECVAVSGCSVCRPKLQPGSFGQACNASGACNSGLTCDSLTNTCQFACGSGDMFCGGAGGNCPQNFACEAQHNICRPSCQGGGGCSGAGCIMQPSGCQVCVPMGANGITMLASNQNAPLDLALDAQFVYWTNSGCAGGGTMCSMVARAPIGGGTTQTVLSSSSNIGNPQYLAVNGNSVFWTAADGHVYTAPAGGGPYQNVSSGETMPQGIVSVLGGSGFLIWADDNPTGTIIRTDNGGGSRVTIASNQSMPKFVGLDQGGNLAYWTTGNGSVMSAPANGGGTPNPVASGLANVGRIVVFGSVVAWTETDGGSVWMKIGGANPMKVATGQNRPFALAIDPSLIYWTNRGDGSVMKMTMTGGAPQMIAGGQADPVAIVVDNTNVYWANQQGGTIMKAAK